MIPSEPWRSQGASHAAPSRTVWLRLCHTLQARIKQMVLPYAVDAQVLASVTLADEAGLLQKTDGSGIGRNAGRFQPMQPQRGESERNDGTHPRRHVAATDVRQPHPVAKAAGLGDAAADVRERQTTHQYAVVVANDKECVALVGAQIFRIAPDPPPERTAGEIVSRPGRFPWREKRPACLTQRRPLVVVGHLRRAQRDALA